MSTSRRKLNLEVKNQDVSFRKWSNLPKDLQLCIVSFAGFQEDVALMQANRIMLQLMAQPGIWRALLQRYFPHDAERLKRRAKSTYLQEFKKCYQRDDAGTTRHLLTLFKEGRLEEIKLQPQLTLSNLLSAYRFSDDQGYTLGQWAAINKHQGVLDHFHAEVMKLCPNSADINASFGPRLCSYPRLYWAAYFNQAKDVTALLEAKAEVNAESKSYLNDTALAAACEMGHTAIVTQLIRAKAQVITPMHPYESSGAFFHSPLYYASRRGDLACLQLLLDVHPVFDPYALRYASRNGHYTVVKTLLTLMPRGHDCANDALTQAAAGNHTDIMSLLVEAKANVNLVNRDAYPTSPFDAAIRKRNEEAVSFLVEHKAEVNVVLDRSDYTPLSSAACYGHTSMVRTLLKAGAKWPHHPWQTDNIFEPHNSRTTPDIKKMLVLAEINQYLSEFKESNVVMNFICMRHKSVLEQLKHAVEIGPDLKTLESIKSWYPDVFIHKKYHDLYNRACSIINPSAAPCLYQCMENSRKPMK